MGTARDLETTITDPRLPAVSRKVRGVGRPEYLAILRMITEQSPSIRIKAWPAVKVDWLARMPPLSIDRAFARLLAFQPGKTPMSGREAAASSTWRRLNHPDSYSIGFPKYSRSHRHPVK